MGSEGGWRAHAQLLLLVTRRHPFSKLSSEQHKQKMESLTTERESRQCTCSKLISWVKMQERMNEGDFNGHLIEEETRCHRGPDGMQPTLLHASEECADEHEDAKPRRTNTDQRETKRQTTVCNSERKRHSLHYNGHLREGHTSAPWTRRDAAHSAACFGGVHGQA